MTKGVKLNPRFIEGSRMLIAMAEYLTKAGWSRGGSSWGDPHPELEGCRANTQGTYEAVRMQLQRDTKSITEAEGE